MHDHHIGVCVLQPTRKQVLLGDVGGEIPAVTFVVTVIGDAAALCGHRADHVEVLGAGRDEVVVEGGAPAAGVAGDGVAEGHDADGMREGEEGEEEGREGETHFGGLLGLPGMG